MLSVKRDEVNKAAATASQALQNIDECIAHLTQAGTSAAEIEGHQTGDTAYLYDSIIRDLGKAIRVRGYVEILRRHVAYVAEHLWEDEAEEADYKDEEDTAPEPTEALKQTLTAQIAPWDPTDMSGLTIPVESLEQPELRNYDLLETASQALLGPRAEEGPTKD